VRCVGVLVGHAVACTIDTRLVEGVFGRNLVHVCLDGLLHDDRVLAAASARLLRLWHGHVTRQAPDGRAEWARLLRQADGFGRRATARTAWVEAARAFAVHDVLC